MRDIIKYGSKENALKVLARKKYRESGVKPDLGKNTLDGFRSACLSDLANSIQLNSPLDQYDGS